MFDYLRNLTKTAEAKQQEALNAYLDDALPQRQRRRFEQQLAQDAGLQAELAQRRHLKEQLRQLPRRPVPRNFMLDPAVYGRPQRQPLFQLYPALRVATVLTAFFFIIAIATDLFLVQSDSESFLSASPDIAMVAEEPAEAAPMEEVEVTRVVTENEAQFEGIAAEAVVEEEIVGEEEAEEEIAVPAAEFEGEALAEPAVETFAETEMADTAAGEASVAAPLSEDADVGAAVAATPTPAPTVEAMRAATASPLPEDASTQTETADELAAATKSVSPRPDTETDESDRAMTQATEIARQEVASESLDTQGEDTDDHPAEPATSSTQSLPGETRQPFSGFRLLQIGLGVALIILASVTFIARRRF